MLNLDTHILLHALDGTLSAGEQRLLAGEAWGISAIVLWEIAKLDFTSDPADELIAATSIVHRAPLMTRDRKLRGSKLVPMAR